MVHKIKVGDKVYTTRGIGRVARIVKAKYSYHAFPEDVEFNKGETVYQIAIPPEAEVPKTIFDVKRKHILRVI